MLSILRWKILCEIRGVADEAMPLCGFKGCDEDVIERTKVTKWKLFNIGRYVVR